MLMDPGYLKIAAPMVALFAQMLLKICTCLHQTEHVDLIVLRLCAQKLEPRQVVPLPRLEFHIDLRDWTAFEELSWSGWRLVHRKDYALRT